MKRSRLIVVVLLCVVAISPTASSNATQSKRQVVAPALIWKNPGEMKSRDLYYGSGSRALAPAPPFTFIEEDKDGTAPKFKVKDAHGVKWGVKLGPETQSETAATRLVWAAGYFTEETYYSPRITVRNLPRLSRGQEYVESGGVVRGARFESRRSAVERGENWSWTKNPFVGTRELNGLRVLMIMLNNWDVKDSNNNILTVSDPRQGRREVRYVVTDLGATLGRAGGIGERRSKSDVEDFVSSRFVKGVDDGMVDFDYNVRPTGFGWMSVVYPPAFRRQWKKGTAMQDIPVAHARWIGDYLARLTNAQLHDAFRAADYDNAAAAAYVRALRARITQLTQLRGSTPQLADVSDGSE
jgi:hypothetical protein